VRITGGQFRGRTLVEPPDNEVAVKSTFPTNAPAAGWGTGAGKARDA